MMSEFIHDCISIKLSRIKKAENNLLFRTIVIESLKGKKEIHLISNSRNNLTFKH